ncbi:BMP family ABC transporter substrate-binding protein [Paucibacter sp. R3-3]|uniref:BMP family ABC transporter substrate-binding protein n=1 Tax=Roseateles agri TaxID=3098619 RepID=A0ABU5DPK7_9BURK|nr:BMP family ABC transporter substrate-binding protein [Paucibacter sp. R3-3]MDY0748256.1 BMP family ABC transporter substrate-binding protein [Paucibacter sp. R3-3]
MRRGFIIKALAAMALGAGLGGAHAAEPMKVAFVYLGPVGDSGWTFQHDLGRRELEAKLGSKITVRTVPSVNEGPDSERVIRELSADGNKLIFAVSFGYMQPALRVAAENPDKFYTTASGYLTAPNVGGYNAKWHEGGYLAGIIAAKTTKSNVLGFVGALPVPDVVWDLNAFTLGARSINPKIQVRTVFVNSWYDPPREREAAVTLMNAGADVLTHFTDTPAVVTAAEERGVPSISFHSDMRKFAPKHYLTGITHQWGSYYTQVTQEVMAGTWKGQLYFGGLKEGTIRMAPFGDSVPKDVRDFVNAKQQDIVSGKLKVFAGPIKDQKGVVRVAAGSSYPDADLGKMDWFVEGVVGGPGR